LEPLGIPGRFKVVFRDELVDEVVVD